ncbi:MAG: family 1 glycosylhydrolase [Janthinobacterium lividum]
MSASVFLKPLELWGGVECSVVRVGDIWRDQVVDTGHDMRGTHDIDLIADLGIRTLRYPVLWERLATGQSSDFNWGWHDRQLDRLGQHKIEVAAGLLHHGSGPRKTSLLDPSMGKGLAVHAGLVAERYPFIKLWTPVNEPLTTARFSCLYGHWYPHRQDEGDFLCALAIQCRAVLLSIRAIRRHIPDARLLQTEDLGRTFSTPPLREQANYENGRRWLSLDLLHGRIDRTHPWRRRFEDAGVPGHDLDELATGEAAPDLIGINHYVTSDRFLDHRLALYPSHMHGGNGRQSYVDTEANRIDLEPGATGWEPRLQEAWTRYGCPMVISEAHLGCNNPHEQVLWLAEAWQAACALRAQGADIRAVTAWALFGLVDWNTMLRERNNLYEPAAFDIRQDPPRPTELAGAIKMLIRNGELAQPAADDIGWWRRKERVHQALREA